MKTTANYALKKPEGTDIVNIDDLNYNADTIDTELANRNADFIRRPPYAVSTNSGNAYSVTTTPAPSAYIDGMGITVKINAASTAAATLNWNSLGAKNIVDSFGAAVTNLRANTIYTLKYESTSGTFILQGKGGGGNTIAAHVLVGETATVDSGPITGTMLNNGAISITPSGSVQTIPAGYTSGGTVAAVSVPVANVLTGTTIAGQAGTMSNKGAVTITPGTTNQTIAAGYHNGLGYVVGDADLVTGNIKSGVTIFGVAGKSSVVETSDATATAAQLLTGQTAYVNGSKITGTMANKSSVSITPGTADQAIPQGYYDGTTTAGKVLGDADLVTANIKTGANIFGIAGSYDTEATSPMAAGDIRSGKIGFVNGAKVTGSLAVQATAAQTVTPTTTNIVKVAGIYDGAITISGDADLVTGNIKSGVTIFGVSGKSSVVETSDATATAAQIRSGSTAYVNGSKLTGTLTVQSTTTQTVTPGTADIVKAAGIYDGVITISGDADLVSSNIKSGVTIFGVAGSSSVVDTTESTSPAAAANILTGKVGFVNGSKITGTMANNGAVTITPGTSNQTIPAGYHSGSGYVAGDADLIAANIVSGKNIFGVAGSYNKTLGTGDKLTFTQMGRTTPFMTLILSGKNGAMVGNDGCLYANTGSTYPLYKYNTSGELVWTAPDSCWITGRWCYDAGNNLFVKEYNPDETTYDYGLTMIAKSNGARTFLTTMYQTGDRVIGTVDGTNVYWLYITTNPTSTMYRCTTTGINTSVSSVFTGVYSYAILRGNYIYTSAVNSGTITIRKFNVATAGSEFLVWTYTGTSTKDRIAVDENGYVYFFSSNSICKLALDGSTVIASQTGLSLSDTEMFGGSGYLGFASNGMFTTSQTTVTTRDLDLVGVSSNGKYFLGLKTENGSYYTYFVYATEITL